MKKTRRIAAFAAALALAATAVAPAMMFASAADTNSITVTGFSNGFGASGQVKNENPTDDGVHTYEAYQIFKGTVSDGKLVGIEWGSAIVNKVAAGETGGYDKSAAILAKFAGAETAADVAEAIKGDDDSDVARAFAELVGAQLDEDSIKVTSDTDGKISGLADGYYLVKDADSSPVMGDGNNSGAKTRYILWVAGGGNVDVYAKSGAPTVEKKVKENVKNVTDKPTYDQSTTEKWNDVADYNIGDAVPFKLYGTMPDTLGDYDSYYYEFQDTLGKEFTVSADTEFTIKVDGKEVGYNSNNIHVITGTDTAGNTTINVVIENIKALTDKNGEAIAVNASSVITVEYEAVLNDNAVLGLNGQQNGVKLVYSNNPNEKYAPGTDKPGDETPDTPITPDKPDSPSTPDKPDDKGDTPEDYVIVFTYALEINKVNESKDKLADAQFVVKAVDGDHEGNYVKVKAIKNAEGEVVRYDVAGWTATKPTKVDTTADDFTVGDAAAEGVFVSTTEGVIQIAGLDDGKYEIEEIAAPVGYNMLTTTLERSIAATTANNQGWDAFDPEDALTALALKNGDVNVDEKKDANKGTVSETIANKSGSTLPSTGGIGTALFYLAGGIMVVGAGTVLVSKKRSKDAE